MPASIDLPSVGDVLNVATTLAKDHIAATYNLDLEGHRLTTEETRGAYWYRFTRTYQRPAAAIVGTLPARFATLWETASVEGGKRGPVRSSLDLSPFAIASAGRQSQRCAVPMPDGGQVTLAVTEDFTVRLSATIGAKSALLSAYGGYCRVHVAWPGSVPAGPPCGGAADVTGQNVTAKYGTAVPVDGPFYLVPAVRQAANQAPLGSWTVVTPSRVNWDYWDPAIGFGPVVVHEAYCSAPKAPAGQPADAK